MYHLYLNGKLFKYVEQFSPDYNDEGGSFILFLRDGEIPLQEYLPVQNILLHKRQTVTFSLVAESEKETIKLFTCYVDRSSALWEEFCNKIPDDKEYPILFNFKSSIVYERKQE